MVLREHRRRHLDVLTVVADIVADEALIERSIVFDSADVARREARRHELSILTRLEGVTAGRGCELGPRALHERVVSVGLVECLVVLGCCGIVFRSLLVLVHDEHMLMVLLLLESLAVVRLVSPLVRPYPHHILLRRLGILL